ncbi:MAG: efflux RND transporter permease subunit [bacterium]
MTLSDLSIKNPVLAWMIFIGVAVFGVLAYLGLGVSQMPDVDFPVLTISTNWPGAAPDVIETIITDPLEEAVMGVQGVSAITSSSSRGRTNITVQFTLGTNIDVALQEVQSRIAFASRDLPKDMEPVGISKSNPDDSPIMWMTVSGDRDRKFVMQYTRDHIKDAFSTIPGVAQVDMGGYLEPTFRVWLDPDKMRKKEIAAEDIISAISSGHSELPAGFLDTGVKEINMRVPGETNNTEEFSSIIIPGRRGATIWQTIRVGDVATVEDGLENVRNFFRSNGKVAVGLGIRKQPGTNAVEVAHLIKKKVTEIQKYMPEGMSLDVRFDTTKFVEDSANDMRFIIIISVILTALVCWLFLGSFSSALNVFLTIPLSIFGTFFVIKMMGFTLNTFTFLGLSLVIGIVVDDAIMVLENITRHVEAGESRIRASIKGSREITFAAIAATIAILAIFIPVIFMSGVIGRYFFQFGVTISSAVIFSLLGALTLTPMYCSQYLKMPKPTDKKHFMDIFMEKFRAWYLKVLTICLNNRWKIVLLSLTFFIASLFLINTVKKEFVPAQDQGRININIQTPPGSSLTFSNEVMKQAEALILQRKDVEGYIASARNSGGFISASLLEHDARPIDAKLKRQMTQTEIMSDIRKDIKKVPGVFVVGIQDLSLSGFTAKRGYPIEFVVMGLNWNKLAECSLNMKNEMEKTGLMVDADLDFKTGMTEVMIIPDRKKAAAHAVNIDKIGDLTSTLFGGKTAGKFTKDGKRYDILVELPDEKRTGLADLKNAWIRNNRGEMIQLSSLVTTEEKATVISITRENRERAIRVFANIAPGKSQGEALQAVQDLAKKILPEGYRIVLTGSAQSYNDSFSSLIIALILGIFVAYMVLGSQFNSFVHPISVLMALPFSLSGAFVALTLTGKTLNIYSAIGIILLMGIVKKNSILLVDFTNQRREKGMSVKDALINACPVRLRPIIMTSAATIAAAIPSALAQGHGAETRVPMALVIIGGVFFSTMLTLFVVPCVYSLLSGLENKAHAKDVHDAIKELDAVAHERPAVWKDPAEKQ